MNQCGKGLRRELVGQYCRSVLYAVFLLFVPASLVGQTDTPVNQVADSAPSAATGISSVPSSETANELDRAEKVIADYQQNRLNFEYKKGNVKRQIEQELNDLKEQIGALERDLHEGEGQLKQVYRPGEPELPEDLVTGVCRSQNETIGLRKCLGCNQGSKQRAGGDVV